MGNPWFEKQSMIWQLDLQGIRQADNVLRDMFYNFLKIFFDILHPDPAANPFFGKAGCKVGRRFGIPLPFHDHPIPLDDPSEPLRRRRPIDHIHLERQIRFAERLFQSGQDARIQRLIPQNGQVQIGVRSGRPFGAGAEGPDFPVGDVRVEDCPNDLPMILADVDAGWFAHGCLVRLRNCSSKNRVSSKKEGILPITFNAFSS